MRNLETYLANPEAELNWNQARRLIAYSNRLGQLSKALEARMGENLIQS